MKDGIEAKQALLKAAIDEFAEYGIGNARTSSIAKRAGVATGLLHYHFGTKANLYSEILNSFFDISFLKDLVIVPFSKECSPLEKIQLIIYAVSRWMSRALSYNMVRFYFRILAAGKDEVNRIITKYSFNLERYIASIIEDGKKQGIFNIKNPYFFIFDIMHTLHHHLALYHLLEDEPEQKEFFTENYIETLHQYFMDTSIRKIVDPGKINSINPVSTDLTDILDKYIDAVQEKNYFSSWNIVLCLLAKLFNDEIPYQGDKE